MNEIHWSMFIQAELNVHEHDMRRLKFSITVQCSHSQTECVELKSGCVLKASFANMFLSLSNS
jgi:hypothetical protein